MVVAETSLEAALDQAAAALRVAERVAVLTGAGVSAESGVPTFRASDGLWEGHRIEDVATPFAFQRNPKLVWSFYNTRRANVRTVKPNAGHYTLAKMEERWGKHFTVVTQNVDGLHLAAGSKNVLEIHGSLYRTRCTCCGIEAHRGLDKSLGEMPECPECSGLLRPAIVWFHESLPEDVWEASLAAAHECDVLLVVGTSAVVHPAASLVPIAKRSKSPGATIIEVNLTRTEASEHADIGLYGKSGEILPQLYERTFSRKLGA